MKIVTEHRFSWKDLFLYNCLQAVLHPEDTILRIYSMTKPITSVAALMLTGRVHVGQVEKYLIVYLCFGGPVAVFILVTDVSSGLFYQDAKRWRYWVLG